MLAELISVFGVYSARGQPSVVFLAGVVSGAGLHFVALLALDLNFAVGPVFLFVGGRVADVVLAAEFGGNLVKGFAQLVELVAHVDHASAGLLRKLAHIAFAGVAKSAIESAIGAQEDVDDGVGFLRGFDGVLKLQTTAFILSVGQDDHGFATDFFRQH